MMGGVHTDIDGATGLQGLYAAGEVACVSINGANRLGSNSLPELLVFGRRAGIAAAEFAAAGGADPGPAVRAQADDERRRLERDLLARRDGSERIADVRTDMQHTMEGSAGIYRDAESLTTGADKLRELRERFGKATIEDGSRTFNTELVAALELGFMLDVAETMVACALRREESRGAPAHGLPEAGRRPVLGALTGLPRPDRFAARRVPAGDDHPLATRRAGLREVGGMPDTIRMQVTRYRPGRDSAPSMQEYVVPLREEWAVLDGLNYIKDQLDGTLSFRWSCRMGICGSCGMTVNGDPVLTCARFLSDYAPGPVRVEPLANFPVIRDLVVEIDDFMRKLPRVKPWLVREDEPGVADVEFLQTPAELDEYKQYSMCINCMLCYAACPVYAIEPDFLGPAAIALAQRYNLDSRDEGAHQRLDVLATAEGVWACTYVGECTSACPKGVDPAGAIQRYKLTAATRTLRSFLLPRGAR
jgi:fumarate reductase iron-sulfur subunit